MIVLDASVVVELLTNGSTADLLRRKIASRWDVFVVPHLLDIEVTSALRTLARAQKIDPYQCEQMLKNLALLPAERYSHLPLLPRIWELRHNFTCYDAAYIALAEATSGVLYTCDSQLQIGHRAHVQLLP